MKDNEGVNPVLTVAYIPDKAPDTATFLDRHEPLERAAVLEELAAAAFVAGRVDDALDAVKRAIRIYDDLGEQAALGRCTRMLSRDSPFSG